jgi:excisionase family DNA binding protein
MTEQTKPSYLDRLAVSPIEAARIAGIGRTKLYEALGSGELRSLKIGKRRLILIDSLQNWLNQHSLDVACDQVARRTSLPLCGPQPRRYRTTVSPHGKDT